MKPVRSDWPRPWAARIGSSPTSATSASTITLGYPLADYFHFWMGNEAGLRTPDGLNIFPVAIPVASQIPQAAGAGLAAKLRKLPRRRRRHLRRRRDLRGRFPRGPELRRRLPDAQRLRLRQQPVRHLRAPVPADRIGDHRPEGRRLRLSRGPGRRERRIGRLRRRPGGTEKGPGGRRPDLDRSLHLPDGRPHHLRRRRALPDQGGSRGMGAPGPAPAIPSLPRPQGALGRGLRGAASRRRPRRSSRRPWPGPNPARPRRRRRSSPTPTR